MRAALPEDGIYVDELTQIGYVARAMFPIYKPRQYIGSILPRHTRLGLSNRVRCRVANPDSPVLSVSGDGGFMFNVQELATAAQRSIDIVSVVFNDGLTET